MAIYSFHQSFQISEYGLGAAIAVVMVLFMFARHAGVSPTDVEDGGGAVTSGTQIAPTPVPPDRASQDRPSTQSAQAGLEPARLAGARRDGLSGVLDGRDCVQAGTADILSYTPHWIPTPPTLSNFRDAINQPFFWDAVKNSLIVVTAVVALSWCSRSWRRSRSRSSTSTDARRSSSSFSASRWCRSRR